jgi:uncharacterized membrane protein
MGGIQVHLRNKLVAGALAAIPLVVTIFILWYVDTKTRAIFNVDHPFLGIGIAIAGLYLLGLFVTSFVGQFVLGAVDSVLRRLPGLRDLYRSWKQVALTTDRHEGIFAHVVLIPGDGGTRMLGFSSAKGIDNDATTWCVFVPQSPNPTSGRLFFVPARRCVLVDMTTQDALKLVISGGSYVPGAIGAATSMQAAIDAAASSGDPSGTEPLTVP